MTPQSPEDAPAEIARDVAAVQRIDALPTLLEALCDLTGMRFAAVARVTDGSWTACAVRDEISFGLPVGGQLPVESTLCLDSKRLNQAIAINQASLDPLYKDHHTPRIYNIESYVSVPIILKNGRYFGNLCSIDPSPADVNNTKVLKIFKRFADLIAVSLLNQEAQAQDLAKLADARVAGELREQFIAILGHDLRNPLQAAMGGTEMLSRKADDPGQVRDHAKRVVTNLKRMSALIEDVLDFARGRLGGGIGLRLDEVEIDLGLEQVVRELQDAQPNRIISAKIQVTQKVRCDLSRIQQVASNLIGNALTHGDASQPVKVTATCDEEHFVLQVWNGGDPIPPDSVSKIFEPFWRNSTSETRQGLGLGLHICAQIVRAHKGKLSVTSTAQAGTTFSAHFPLR